ncbi:hypothetical protein KCV87_28135 [Actinosynnema pretiosum subsp. pretiosum]|uniref:Uncharacterized protein n=2 Tax=Actinosynnema TaxID=40566 RepID=C6WA92_ACTMD|nr:hypothetical protein [Actinosynnema mirum]ACU39281.1 hypothetical protein Amir_5463 [Actinosynnema mirum DSM 43827]QUF03253.1 hypothetical protein KCV87_28135 [Actinosynnema pretiosum subsp. pretiosum]
MRNLGPRGEVAVALSILGAGAAVVVSMHLTWPEPEVPVVSYSISGGEAGVADLKPFEIDDVSGASVELTPGAQGSRTVRLSNPNDVDIMVMSLQAEPGDPVDEGRNPVDGCGSDVLTVDPMDQPVIIPPEGSVDVAMVVRIAGDIPPACQDLVFPLTYSGRATRG